MTKDVRFINPDGLKLRSHFSQLVVFQPGQMVLLSGQVAINSDGKVVGLSFEDQLQQSLANVNIALSSADCSWSDILQLKFYVVDLCYERRLLIERALLTLFDEQPPVSSLFGVQKLARKELLVEIEALAIL